MIIVTVRLSDLVILVLFAFAERKIYSYTYAYHRGYVSFKFSAPVDETIYLLVASVVGSFT